jgi:hypothetical protein
VIELPTDEQSLQYHFSSVLELPDAAVIWLLDLWQVIQAFDDIVDGEEVSKDQMMDVVVKSLIGLPANPFYMANAQTLQPMIMSSILKWKASDDAEREGKADEKSFVWRASYYDVVLMVTLLCHGWKTAMEKAKTVMSLYGETFAKYKEEFQ